MDCLARHARMYAARLGRGLGEGGRGSRLWPSLRCTSAHTSRTMALRVLLISSIHAVISSMSVMMRNRVHCYTACNDNASQVQERAVNRRPNLRIGLLLLISGIGLLHSCVIGGLVRLGFKT